MASKQSRHRYRKQRVFKYSSELRSMTGGRGSFEVEFSHYEQVPQHIAQKVITEAQAAKKAEQES